MPESSQVQSNRDYTKTVTIAVGQSDSEAINIAGTNLIALLIPENMTASFINFLVSDAINGIFLPLKTNTPKTSSSDPAEFTVALNVVSGTPFWYGFKPEDLAPWEFIKIKSVDSSDVGDNQLTTPAVIKLALRPIS